MRICSKKGAVNNVRVLINSGHGIHAFMLVGNLIKPFNKIGEMCA